MTLDIKANRFNQYLLRNYPNGLSVIHLVANSQSISGLERSDILKIVSSYSHLFEVRKDSYSDNAIVVGKGKLTGGGAAVGGGAGAHINRRAVRTAPAPGPVTTRSTARTRATSATTTTTTATTTPISTVITRGPPKETTDEIAKQRHNRVQTIAMEFYNQILKDNPYLRQKCQDRNEFSDIYSSWKVNEQRRNPRRNFRGSSPGTILHILNHELNIIDAVADGQFIVWRDKPNTTSTSTSKSNQKKMNRKERIQNVMNRVKHDRKQLELNKNGIEIDQVTFGLEDNSVARIGTELTQHVMIHNTSSDTAQIVVKDLLAFKRGFTVVFPDTARNKTIVIDPHDSHSVLVSHTPDSTGITRSILTFEIQMYKNATPSSSFSIVRYLSIEGGDPDDHSILKPNAPYSKKKRSDYNAFANPERVTNYKGSHHGEEGRPFKDLQSHGIPKTIRNTIKNGYILDEVIALFYDRRRNIPQDDNEIPSDLSHKLSMSNYRAIMERLLWMEEFTMERDIQTYDMTNVLLDKKGRSKYSIHVPGLAESRPSVLRGDKITIQCSEGCFMGVVDRTEQESAIVTFPQRLDNHFTNGLRVNVRFSFKRMSLRLCHDALSVIDSKSNPKSNPTIPKRLLQQILFPDHQQMERLPSLIVNRKSSRLVWFNRDLNEEQRTAVEGAISCVYRPLPYLIWGPPGTGKTISLVETILQTVRAKGADKSSRVLVCAPSNQATDLILQRLSPYLRPNDMLRILAFSRSRDTVPSEILDYAYYSDQEEGFVIPPEHVVKEKKVVCVTIGTSAKLPFHNVLGHFTHVFIDEAGHAMEPEAISCFIKTMNVLKDEQQPPAIVLAGDPKQLGPIIRSNSAKSFGLEKSLLERLYQRLEAEDLATNTDIMTKLIRNYRSHPAILKCPNERFYSGDLVASADPFVNRNLEQWEHLPTKKFPIVFHGVEGQDKREGNSPSWFNSSECGIVREYVDKLVKYTKKNKVKPEDIGIISPYHKQVQKISMLLRAHDYGECKVGSVEEFQGSERRVIIISTVRSSVEYLKFDNNHKLGFVSNPKRFNVAITRAQALLIVIGNPNVLTQDPDWKSFIEYTVSQGGYTGCAFKVDGEDGENSDFEEMSNLSLEDDRSDDVNEESATTGQEGPAWRSEE